VYSVDIMDTTSGHLCTSKFTIPPIELLLPGVIYSMWNRMGALLNLGTWLIKELRAFSIRKGQQLRLIRCNFIQTYYFLVLNNLPSCICHLSVFHFPQKSKDRIIDVGRWKDSYSKRKGRIIKGTGTFCTPHRACRIHEFNGSGKSKGPL